MRLNLEEWEVGMILCALEELPREEAAETIRRIEEQMAQDIICCKGVFALSAFFFACL